MSHPRQVAWLGFERGGFIGLRSLPFRRPNLASLIVTSSPSSVTKEWAIFLSLPLLRTLEETSGFAVGPEKLLGQAYKQAVEAKKLTAMPLITRLSEVGNERKGFFETEHFKIVVEHLPEHLKDFVSY